MSFGQENLRSRLYKSRHSYEKTWLMKLEGLGKDSGYTLDNWARGQENYLTTHWKPAMVRYMHSRVSFWSNVDHRNTWKWKNRNRSIYDKARRQRWLSNLPVMGTPRNCWNTHKKEYDYVPYDSPKQLGTVEGRLKENRLFGEFKTRLGLFLVGRVILRHKKRELYESAMHTLA